MVKVIDNPSIEKSWPAGATSAAKCPLSNVSVICIE